MTELTVPIMDRIKTRMGSRLREFRASAKLSQLQVCSRAGIAYSTYSQLEGGKGDPQLSTLVAVSRFFKKSPSELLR